MSIFRKTATSPVEQDGAPSQVSLLLPLIATLLITGILTDFYCRLPIRSTISWPQLLSLALDFFVITVLAHAWSIWVIRKLFPAHVQLPAKTLIIGLWSTVAWLPLLSTLKKQQSFLVVALPTLITASAVMFLKRWSPAPERAEPAYHARELFQSPPQPSFAHAILPAFASSVAIQGGIGSLIAGWLLGAGLLFAIAALFPLWLLLKRPRRDTRQSLAWHTLLVLLLTIVVLTPYIGKGGLAARIGGLLKTNLANAAKPKPKPEEPSLKPDNYYSGVVLFVPPKPKEKIVPPSPQEKFVTGMAHAKPVIIPFDGPYWYFKRPDIKPRKGARVVHGDPTKANIKSTDHWPLAMEAHQFLATPIRMSCCRAIRISLTNADNRPGSISIEIVLKDGPLTQSLGSEVIPSSQLKTISLTRQPIEESMTFTIPQAARGKQFDEISVVIQPSKERSLSGAHIAVQQFVLVP